MVKKTYKELLEGLKYSDLGYTGERKPLTDPKYKQFTDTINKNTAIANTHIDSSLPTTMPQAQVSGQGTAGAKNPWAKDRRNAGLQDPKGAETTQPETVPTTDTPLTIDAKYSDFTKWAQEHGVDSDKVFQDAMALARTQYEQSRATYGLQAEQLAQAGLTNSGVSDNLERAAYAQKVQAEQAALDQKAALDLANKQAYGAYKDQQKQQYTDLFQKYVFGYEDEFGNIHAPVSPDEAEALLKLAGLNDEAMIADIRKSYDEYKGIGDKKVQEQQQAIAGLDTTTDADGNTTVNGFSADSMFGKLFSGDMSSDEFLDQIEADYGVRFNTDEEAVDALRARKLITKDMESLFYRERANNTLEAIKEAGFSAKEMLKKGDSELFNAINSAYDAYKAGKMLKADWDAFRKELLSNNSFIHFGIESKNHANAAPWEVDVYELQLTIGDTKASPWATNAATRRVEGRDKHEKLENLSNGLDFVVYEGNLYAKITEKNADGYGQRGWVRIGNVKGTKKKNWVEMISILVQS